MDSKLYNYEFVKMLLGGKVPSFDEKNYNKGIIRINKNNKFSYKYTNNEKKEITNEDFARINALKLPPGWDYCWISGDPTSEIQAVGIDSAGRKQYKYLPEFHKKTVDHRYNNFKLFIKLFDKLLEVIKKDMKLPPLNKNKICATLSKIILITGIRAGKEFYARTNKSYGITSLRRKHIKLNPPDEVVLSFRGKKGVNHIHKFNDKDIYDEMTILYKINNVPMQKKQLANKEDNDKFFVYEEDGKLHKIIEHDLNHYLHNKVHPDIVIKDLRTFVVNFILIKQLQQKCKEENYTKTQLKKILKECIIETADFIQHTPTISRKAYMYPDILNQFINNYDLFYKNKKSDTYEFLKKLVNK
jgi:DNA topoisomerase I